MKKRQQHPSAVSTPRENDEPMGIVISSGQRREPEPRFAAYVWGPVPEAECAADEVVAVA